MSQEILSKLGPLAKLAGVWEGDKGDDSAPDDDRNGTEKNAYRERATFVPFGPQTNHEQILYGLRYSMVAHRIGEENAFHEETGYWLWDEKEQQVMRTLMIPRGITVLAGGKAKPGAKSFQVSAEAGSDVYGICSNPFLDREFKTVRYEMKISFEDENTLSYESHVHLKMRGREKVFDHIDRNRLKRIEPAV